jgi:hypothetical protein
MSSGAPPIIVTMAVSPVRTKRTRRATASSRKAMPRNVVPFQEMCAVSTPAWRTEGTSRARPKTISTT